MLRRVEFMQRVGHLLRLWLIILICVATTTRDGFAQENDAAQSMLQWQALPDLPDSIGVAGPFVGVHADALIVAGGANFPIGEGDDLWTAPKVWHDRAWVLTRNAADDYQWQGEFQLSRQVAYGACVSTPHGVVCIGGNDSTSVHTDVFLLQWDASSSQLIETALPSLPMPLAYSTAALIGDTIYLAGGQTEAGLESATSTFLRLDLSEMSASKSSLQWEILPSWPGPARAFHLVAAQHNGFEDCVYVIGGRRQDAQTDGLTGIVPLADCYEFRPSRYQASAFDSDSQSYTGQGEFAEPWRVRSSAPTPIMAGSAAAMGQSHIFALSGANGELLESLQDDPSFVERHPGFPRNAWTFHTITNTWVNAGSTPQNQVTTPIARWGDALILASGEIRPRVRTAQIWRVTPQSNERAFGALNFTVLVVYLLAMLGVGFYFMRRNKNTNDYFRGGEQVAWWAAGCSIFATMLSSITFMAIPAKAFAQDWVYLVGNLMILVLAPVAVYLALPFFRRIDATSAYEYLEQRFSRPVRLFASGLFTLFHVFRMAIVMSLAGLALATVTPMTAAQCVLAMGILSVLYSTLGGIEAVIWTDTIQAIVLLGGAVLCVILMVSQTQGGIDEFLHLASSADKFRVSNFHLDASSASLALWVVILGALGQNWSSYTSDQAVVQRYMTTSSTRRAAQAIWMAAALAIPASILFFSIGSGLFVFYSQHPEKLDPTFLTDQIFPLFIVNELPVGLAGLIVAGIFAAAQSTVSTSMNSTATTLTTDFLRPFHVFKSERSYFVAARVATLSFGVLGTLLGLLFVHPDIKSLFDQFLRVVGLFMGVLGGLFALGMLTRRCTSTGALIGVLCGAAILFGLQTWSGISGYLYASIGAGSCFMIGYLASCVLPTRVQDLTGLTIHTLLRAPDHSDQASRLS